MIEERVLVYVASKSVHGPAWRMWRDIWRRELPHVRIVSTWIDESGEGEPDDMADLWTRSINEASSAHLVIAYHGPGEEWKGAFLEIGAALAHGADVLVLGDPPGSWKNHPRVQVMDPSCDIGCAMVDYLARRRA